MKASYSKHTLEFRLPGGTSRGILTHKETWFITIADAERFGIGECGMFRGLSHDDRPDYEEQLAAVCQRIGEGPVLLADLVDYPSIRFGLEQAFASLKSSTGFDLFPSDFTRGHDYIPINGLIWMGDIPNMRKQVADKISQGFKCIKIKIGALDFKSELAFLKEIREAYGKDVVLRVDANGAFKPGDALDKLHDLSRIDIHSIEQPIAPGQREAIKKLCLESPVPIALDEELIGINATGDMEALVAEIRPAYLILKPSLIGGFTACLRWIDLAKKYGSGWWITSALESNIGLNAIAQWTYTLKPGLPQGLGTGGVFKNNFESPLYISRGSLNYDPEKEWDRQSIKRLCI